MATDPAVQAARALILEKRGQGDMFVDDLAELLVAAVTPLIRRQAFTEAAHAIEVQAAKIGTDKYKDEWIAGRATGLDSAAALVRGLSEGTASVDSKIN